MGTSAIPASDVSARAGTQSHDLRLRRLAFAAGVALLFALLALDAAAQGRREKPPEEAPEQFPAGAHRDDTFYFCTACHGFKIVAQQGMSRERWSETFDFMVTRHKVADVQGEDGATAARSVATWGQADRAAGEDAAAA